MTYTQELEKALETLRIAFVETRSPEDYEALQIVLEAARLYLEQLR